MNMNTGSDMVLQSPIISLEDQAWKYGQTYRNFPQIDAMLNFDQSKTFDFLNLPVEIKQKIFLGCIDVDEGAFETLGRLIAALRPEENTYQRALNVFYDKAQFTLATGADWSIFDVEQVPMKWRSSIRSFFLDFGRCVVNTPERSQC